MRTLFVVETKILVSDTSFKMNTRIAKAVVTKESKEKLSLKVEEVLYESSPKNKENLLRFLVEFESKNTINPTVDEFTIGRLLDPYKLLSFEDNGRYL